MAFLYVRFKPDEQGRIIPWGERIDTSVLQKFRDSLGSTKNLAILEGLPHQGWERDLWKAEIAAKETTKIHGFHFYAKRITPSDNDVQSLITVISDENGIVEWRGMKMCGSYHPDFVLQWYDSDGELHQALICFGCHEIKLYGKGIQLYADLSKDAYDALKRTLLHYEDQRPKRNEG